MYVPGATSIFLSIGFERKLSELAILSTFTLNEAFSAEREAVAVIAFSSLEPTTFSAKGLLNEYKVFALFRKSEARRFAVCHAALLLFWVSKSFWALSRGIRSTFIKASTYLS